MKLYLLVLFVCLNMHIKLVAQNADENAIANVLIGQVNAWNNGDIQSYMNAYWQNDSLLFISAGGVIHGWKELSSQYQNSYPDAYAMGKLSYSLQDIKPVSTNVYLVVGKWYHKQQDRYYQGIFSIVFRKISNKWQIVNDHSN